MSKDYVSIAKEHWRRWVWNRVIERIPKLGVDGFMRKNATVLYLVGPEDFDRPLAVEKGFRTHNLIAVDLDKKCVSRVRRAGNLAVCARLEDLVATWPEDWPIHAVVADFTCGLDNKTAKTFLAALYTSRATVLGKTVVAVNLQRGRDPDSNPIREAIEETRQYGKSLGWWGLGFDKAIKVCGSPGFQQMCDIMLDNLHRGKQLFTQLFVHSKQSLSHTGLCTPDYPDVFMEATNPIFYSYRQNVKTPYMDSVVFTMPHGDRGDFQSSMQVYSDIAGRRISCGPLIAALKAVRTMKIRSSVLS